MLCLVEAGLGSRQATAIRPDRLIVPAGDSRPDDLTLSAQADAGAVSADWLLLLCLWRGRQGLPMISYKYDESRLLNGADAAIS